MGLKLIAVENERVNLTPTITEKRIKAAEMCLIACGVEAGEADTVLQAVGYILLDRELYPERSKREAWQS